jgi:hypothetical protein
LLFVLLEDAKLACAYAFCFACAALFYIAVVQDRRFTFQHACVSRLTNTQKSKSQSESAMSTRFSRTIKSLHETQSVDVQRARIDNDKAEMLAIALKENTTVTNINLRQNQIGDEGATAKSVTNLNLRQNRIGAEGASSLADALKVNSSVIILNLGYNAIGAEGASAIADALKVDTSVTNIDLIGTGVRHLDELSIQALIDRNQRLRHLFLFDARQMLLSVLCADECGVVWPYVLEGDDLDVIKASRKITKYRAEFAAVVEERRRRAAAARRLVADEVAGKGDSRAAKRVV